MENQTKTPKQINLKKIDPKQIIGINKWEKIQKQIVIDNPFIEITDTETYKQAKANRTALLKGKTSLLGVNGQEGAIRSSLKRILNGSLSILQNLAEITIPHYEKQQQEIKRYEAIIDEKRKERERKAEEERLIEQKRIEDINNQIDQIYRTEKLKVDNLTFKGIDALKTDWEKNLKQTDTQQFDEFEVTFFKTIERLDELLNEKAASLTISENQRLETIKLEKEKAKFEAEKAKAREIERKKQAKIDAENKKKAKELEEKYAKIKEEKERLEKIENDRLEKIRLEKEKKERIKRERAEAKRLKAMQPDLDKAVDIINFYEFDTTEIENIKDVNVKKLLAAFLADIKGVVSSYLTEIQDLKQNKPKK